MRCFNLRSSAQSADSAWAFSSVNICAHLWITSRFRLALLLPGIPIQPVDLGQDQGHGLIGFRRDLGTHVQPGEDIHQEVVLPDRDTGIGGTLQEAVDFQLALGPAGEVFREAGEEAERRREEVEQALRDALAPYQEEIGVVMPSSSWTITARRPVE